MVPLRDRMPLADLALHVRATYAGGATLEDVDAIAWSNAADQAMIVFFITMHAELARRSFHDMCPQCRLYVNFGPRLRYAVLSVLSAGGGDPVVSTGLIDVGDNEGKHT